MRALLAAELGLLSDDAVVPFDGRTLMQGPVSGDGQEDDLSSGEEDEEEPDLLSLGGGRRVVVALTPESVQAALALVFRGRERLLPKEIMTFPGRTTLRRYQERYQWKPRKPNYQHAARFAGSGPEFLGIYFHSVWHLFAELRIHRLCQVLFQDEIIFCAELDKVKRQLAPLVPPSPTGSSSAGAGAGAPPGPRVPPSPTASAQSPPKKRPRKTK